jgi:hypothetical protein
LSDRTTTTRYTRFILPLPFLLTLSLHRVYIDPSTADHFIDAAVLPKLVALSVNGCRLIEDPLTLTDLGPFEERGLAAQLEVLHISAESEDDMIVQRRNGRPAENDPYDLVTKCDGLRSLSITVSAISADLLDNLPTESLTHLTLLPPAAGKPDRFEPHLAAAHALSTSFLALAASASSSLSTTPHGGRFPFSSSLSTSPVASSPFSSPAVSPPADASRAPLSQLLELTLPATWDVDDGGRSWSGNGEFAWAVRRIMKECEKREVKVSFLEAGRRRAVEEAGPMLLAEVERARRAVSGE